MDPLFKTWFEKNANAALAQRAMASSPDLAGILKVLAGAGGVAGAAATSDKWLPPVQEAAGNLGRDAARVWGELNMGEGSLGDLEDTADRRSLTQGILARLAQSEGQDRKLQKQTGSIIGDSTAKTQKSIGDVQGSLDKGIGDLTGGQSGIMAGLGGLSSGQDSLRGGQEDIGAGQDKLESRSNDRQQAMRTYIDRLRSGESLNKADGGGDSLPNAMQFLGNIFNPVSNAATAAREKAVRGLDPIAQDLMKAQSEGVDITADFLQRLVDKARSTIDADDSKTRTFNQYTPTPVQK